MSNISVRTCTEVRSAVGGESLEQLTLVDCNSGEAIDVAPGDGHTVYVPLPTEMDLRFGLLMRDV